MIQLSLSAVNARRAFADSQTTIPVLRFPRDSLPLFDLGSLITAV